MLAEVRLDIHADPVCPWCLIGKAWLDRALEGAPDHPFAVVWHPLRLNPDMPPGGMDHRDWLELRHGSQMGAVEALKPVLAAAHDAGITLNLPAIARMPDTTDAHRLILWAGLEGRQTPVMGALMRAHWREGRDIGDHATLTEIAAKAGMDRTVTARLLASDADRATVHTQEAETRHRGIRATPTFVIAGTHVLPGAQPVALWRDVLAELRERAP